MRKVDLESFVEGSVGGCLNAVLALHPGNDDRIDALLSQNLDESRIGGEGIGIALAQYDLVLNRRKHQLPTSGERLVRTLGSVHIRNLVLPCTLRTGCPRPSPRSFTCTQLATSGARQEAVLVW
jgi:hypothetical protein